MVTVKIIDVYDNTEEIIEVAETELKYQETRDNGDGTFTDFYNSSYGQVSSPPYKRHDDLE